MAVEWMTDAAVVEDTASFFQSNVDEAYISHSELMWGRAATPSEWCPDLAGFLRRELSARVENGSTASQRVARYLVDGELIGVAFLEFHRDAPIPFGVLEDIVIARDKRNTGYGRDFLNWITEQMREQGLRRIFLESGLGNDDAHHWFVNHGFEQVSIVMMAEIPSRGAGAA